MVFIYKEVIISLYLLLVIIKSLPILIKVLLFIFNYKLYF